MLPGHSLLIVSLLVAVIEVAPFTLHTVSSSGPITYRSGEKGDEIPIATVMARELMNPLGIQGKRFIVAEKADGDRIGWAQLKPLGPAIVDPTRYDSSPGSGSVEGEADEEMWALFEEEKVEFPNGPKSLPWTEEYRAMAEAAEARRNKRAAIVARERAAAGQLWELASVYVTKPFRGQGVGSELVRRIMAEHKALDRASSDVYALTLATTIDWYSKFGFEVTDDPPAPMAFEISAGKVITRLIGAELVCIRGGSSRAK